MMQSFLQSSLVLKPRIVLYLHESIFYEVTLGFIKALKNSEYHIYCSDEPGYSYVTIDPQSTFKEVTIILEDVWDIIRLGNDPIIQGFLKKCNTPSKIYWKIWEYWVNIDNICSCHDWIYEGSHKKRMGWISISRDYLYVYTIKGRKRMLYDMNNQKFITTPETQELKDLLEERSIRIIP